MKIRNRLIILFEVDFWGYFTYLLVKGKDSDDFTFVSIKFYENHREDLERPGTNKWKKYMRVSKKPFSGFQNYDGRACPNAPPRPGKSKYLDPETQLITKRLFK